MFSKTPLTGVTFLLIYMHLRPLKKENVCIQYKNFKENWSHVNHILQERWIQKMLKVLLLQ